MWKESGVELLPGIFDFDRNILLALRLKQIFPEARLLTNEVLFYKMRKITRKKYGNDIEIELWKMLGRDYETHFNHHTHFHVHLGTKINWNFDVRNFIPRIKE